MFVDTMIFFSEGSYLKTSTSLNLHLDILTPWLTPNHRNPPSQVDHQVISRAAKGFPARHNMWSPSRRGKPLALNVTSGTEKKTWLAPLVVFDSTSWPEKKDVMSFLSMWFPLFTSATFEIPNIKAHESHAPKLGTSPWAEFGTRDRTKIWGVVFVDFYASIMFGIIYFSESIESIIDESLPLNWVIIMLISYPILQSFLIIYLGKFMIRFVMEKMCLIYGMISGVLWKYIIPGFQSVWRLPKNMFMSCSKSVQANGVCFSTWSLFFYPSHNCKAFQNKEALNRCIVNGECIKKPSTCRLHTFILCFQLKHLSQSHHKKLQLRKVPLRLTMTKSLFKRHVMNNMKALRKQQEQEQEK